MSDHPVDIERWEIEIDFWDDSASFKCPCGWDHYLPQEFSVLDLMEIVQDHNNEMEDTQ